MELAGKPKAFRKSRRQSRSTHSHLSLIWTGLVRRPRLHSLTQLIRFASSKESLDAQLPSLADASFDCANLGVHPLFNSSSPPVH